MPFKYKWAWEKYLAACANHWMPQEINMSRDIATWKDPNGLTEDERRIIKRNLGFFVTADSLAANNIVLGTYRHITRAGVPPVSAAPGLRRGDPYPRLPVHRREPGPGRRRDLQRLPRESQSIRDKDEFLIPFIDALMDPAFKTGTPEADQTLLKSLIVFACIMEGLFFYVGFTQILALGRQNKMTGAAEQYQYILRDESMHCNFGIDLINQIKMENPHLWTAGLPRRDPGLFMKRRSNSNTATPRTPCRAACSVSTRRCSRNICAISPIAAASRSAWKQLYPGASNPFPWMSEMIDLKKERNFFETRVIEYQTGGALSWE